jgi:predicted patatin/cPLA2 family phospholipase
MTKRALIFAGGGLKVAFEAGVLQVWLDEVVDTEFHLADGASGGTFNLAMWCQGMSGTEIANAWRRTNPLSWFAVNPRPWRAFSSLDRFRDNVLHGAWGVDWDLVHERNVDATFNVYNFTDHALEQRRPLEMNDEWLLACVALPFWFPPQVIDGRVYIDSVYATDANLESAIDRGADELWIVWTMNTEGRWGSGPVNQYFTTIEAAANWRLKELVRRIDENNAAMASPERNGEFGRHIERKILRATVPLHYIFVFSADTLHEAVELGVQRARAWCDANGIRRREPPARRGDRTRLRFSETMVGPLAFGENATDRAVAGSGAELEARLTVDIDDVANFLTDPAHEARVTGAIVSDALGGKLPLEEGTLHQFVYEDDPWDRRMRYRLRFRDGGGHPLVLEGEKRVPSGPGFHPWRDTTTLSARIYSESADVPEQAAAAVIRITLPRFARQLTTFRAHGHGTLGGARLVLRYFAFFVSVCARGYLTGRERAASSEAPRSDASQT